MAEEKNEINTFAEMAKDESSKTPTDTAPKTTATPAQPKEISIEDFSDTAVGDRVKYTRPDLNDAEDVVDKFQVFLPSADDDQQTSQSGDVKYWKVSCLLTYASKNADGAENREYISGAKAFTQRDGSPSEPSFWYEGGSTQLCTLWETVAKKLGKESKDISPREFIAFLNSKPKVKIASMPFKNFGAPAGAPKLMYKNMPGEFL